MNCRRCDAIIPDHATACPACGRPRTGTARRTTPVLTVIRFSDFLVFLAVVLNVVIVYTASHYCVSYEAGIFYEKTVMYYYFPILKLIDTVSIVFLFLCTALAAAAHYHMKHERRLGLILMLTLHALMLLWLIGYPVLIYLITGIVTYILYFTMVQTTLYFAFSAFFSLYLIRSNTFLV